MAKRFTDTNKFKKPFFRGLQGPYKLLWDYLYHDCDNAGVWIVDFDAAQLYLGKDMKVGKEKALELFNREEIRIVEIDNNKKWFLPSFIEFQYGKLSENNRAHTGVISQLQKYDLLNPDFSIKPLTRPLLSPLQGDKDKDMDKDIEVGGTGEGKKKFIPPTQEQMRLYFTENGYSRELSDRAWKGYEADSWKDSQGNPVRNWQRKCQHVWFTERNAAYKVEPDRSADPRYDREVEKQISAANNQGWGLSPDQKKYLAQFV